MSSSRTSITVTAVDGPLVELRIVDDQLRPVAQGQGYLAAELPPGIYEVQATTGLQSWEQLVSLGRGKAVSPVHVEVPALALESAAPLYAATYTHEYHEAGASEERARVHVRVGSGSAIFVMSRCYSATEAGPSAPAEHPLAGLTLRDREGRLLVDLVESARYEPGTPGDATFDPWAACNVTVDPGYYRLRQALPAGKIVEMPLVAVRNWQLQVFTLAVSREASPTLRANLMDSFVYYGAYDARRSEPAESFGAQGMRLTEIARQALTSRKPLAGADLRPFLSGKFDNPMLGILGGYLLLLSEEPNLGLLRIVVGNLRRMLGREHPDVEALALKLGGAHNYTFETPPMLRQSWESVLRASVSRPEIVPLESLSAEIAPRLWGEGIWMLWNAPESAAAPAPLARSREAEGEAPALTSQERAVMEQLSAAAVETGRGVSRSARPTARARRSLAPEGLSATAPKLDEATTERLVYSLGLPRGSVDQMAKELSEKAQRYQETRREMPSGRARTREMNRIVRDIRSLSAEQKEEAAQALAQAIAEDSEGSRIAALGLLQEQPDPQHLAFVLSAISQSRSAFEQYQALHAALLMLTLLDGEQKGALKAAIEAQRGEGPGQYIRPGTDRWGLSDRILDRLSS